MDSQALADSRDAGDASMIEISTDADATVLKTLDMPGSSERQNWQSPQPMSNKQANELDVATSSSVRQQATPPSVVSQRAGPSTLQCLTTTLRSPLSFKNRVGDITSDNEEHVHSVQHNEPRYAHQMTKDISQEVSHAVNGAIGSAMRDVMGTMNTMMKEMREEISKDMESMNHRFSQKPIMRTIDDFARNHPPPDHILNRSNTVGNVSSHIDEDRRHRGPHSEIGPRMLSDASRSQLQEQLRTEALRNRRSTRQRTSRDQAIQRTQEEIGRAHV
jgi:hypothetical protein